MAETDYVTLEDESGNAGRRTVMHILYGMHTVSPFTLWSLSVIALIVHYMKRADERDPLYLAHHNDMIRTVWWTLLWLVITGPLRFRLFFPAAIASTEIRGWSLYACPRGRC